MKKTLCTLFAVSLIFTLLLSTFPAVADDDKSNNLLSSISVNYGKLDPEFDSETTKYTLYIPSDITELIITPTPQSKSATANKIDMTLAIDQEPTIAVTCTAQDGEQKQYKLKIKRIDKTLSEIEDEIAQNGYAVYIKQTKFYQNTDFIVTISFVFAGIIILIILYFITRRKLINPFDKDEKPFYKKQ